MNLSELSKNKLSEILQEAGKAFENYPDKMSYFQRESYKYHLETLSEIKKLGIKKGASILDVGTGCGLMPITLSKLGYNCWAIDDIEHLDSFATKIIKESNVKFSLVDVTREKLPYPDNFFDCVISECLIEHLHHSPKKLLMEIRRVLKNKEYFILITPNLGSLRNRIISVLKFTHPINLEYFYNSDIYRGHIREYKVNEVKRILNWAYFKIIKTRTFDIFNTTTGNKGSRGLAGKILDIIVFILKKILFFNKNNKNYIITVTQKVS